MAGIRIVVPDATTNYVLNPAIRYDTTGWTAFGATISRTLDYARFGTASLKVVTSGLAMREGTYYRVNALAGLSEPVTASVYVRGAGRIHIRLIDNPAGKEWVSDPLALRNDRWQRIEVTGYSTGSNDMRLYVETDGVPRAITFYVDGAQMERHPYSTTYCDGDQAGCAWNMVQHASLSRRLATTRLGGRWVALTDLCGAEQDIYVTLVGGMGMAPILNDLKPYAAIPGSYLRASKITSRPITLTVTARASQSSRRGVPNLAELHRLRQEVLDIVKGDRSGANEPFLMEYLNGDRPVYLWASYEGGMEGEWDIRNPAVNTFPLKLLATDPLLFEDDQEVQNLKLPNAEANTVRNIGSITIRPIFHISGPLQLASIENVTTGYLATFSLTTLVGEEVDIDVETGIIRSNMRGILQYPVSEGSEFHQLCLLPGDNIIKVTISHDVDATVQIIYTPKHWSADATATGPAETWL